MKADFQPPETMHTRPHPEMNVNQYGPTFWAFVHTYFGTACWNESASLSNFFQETVKAFTHFLDIGQPNNKAGCPYCYHHFCEFIVAHPPDRVACREEATVWWWLAHNAVNRQKETAELSYDEASRRWFMVPLPDTAVRDIEAHLKA